MRLLCSVLLSILAPHVALPPGIDLLKCRRERTGACEVSPVPDGQSVINFGTTAEASGKSGHIPSDMVCLLFCGI